MLSVLRSRLRRLEEAPLLLSLLAIVIATAVSLVMAHVAGIHAVEGVLDRFQPVWLAPMLGARVLSYAGYLAAHRATLTPGRRRRISADTAIGTVAFGAAATSLGGGFSIDHRVMRSSGASPRMATVKVLNLGALELATLAPAAWICALELLGAPRTQAAVTLPWAVGVPCGLVLALLLAWRLQPGSLARKGALGRAASRALEALSLLATQARHPLRYAMAWLGMIVYWAAEILSLWAALRMFAVHASVDIVILAYATGHVLTPRSLPLSGAGVTELLLPLALNWSGLHLAMAVPGVFAYRAALLALAIPPAVIAHQHVRNLLHVTRARRAGART